jgi:hypothetical protein
LIQFSYWIALTGKPLYYSYDNPGEGFEFLTPFVWQVLFSFRKGWLIYAPMMIFSIIGLYYVYRKNRKIFLAVFLFFLFNLYIVSSWSCWWYGGSFGQRALMQSYAIMFIPFGYFITSISMSAVWKKLVFSGLAIFFTFLNIFQIWQLSKGIIHESRMTFEYYTGVFGKTSVTEEQKDLLMVERPATSMEFFTDEDNYLEPRQIYFENFENISTDWASRTVDTLSFSGLRSIRINPDFAFSPGLNIAFRDLVERDHAWIRAGVYIYPIEGVDLSEVFLVTTFDFKGRSYKYRTTPLSALPEVKYNQWNYLEKDYITPEVRSRRDKFSVYVWYPGDKEIFVDDLRVIAFDPE